MKQFLHKFLLNGRRFSSLARDPFRVCIVGSGPAGFYTADKMLKADLKAEIDMIDRLPTPFGLVRSGVAPDHPETKVVVNQFSRVAGHERFGFFGNVELGKNVSLSELHNIYDAVVLAYGAESDRSLNIPGEGLRGIYSAREFVWWYNGHPDFANFVPDLTGTDTAVILGQGNVALDVARILLRPINELEKTDIAERALNALRKSTIRKVYLVGRRGPVQAACTAKELREILGVKNLHIHIDKSDLATTQIDEEEMKNSRIRKRVYELLSKAATSAQKDETNEIRDLHFSFFKKPIKFIPSENESRVSGVQFERTILKEEGNNGKQVAVGTGKFDEINCGLVLKSIGYKSLPVEGLPFDSQKGVVPNIEGRVLNNNEKIEQGLYCVGWLKRGPTGIIGTNLYCAEETVGSILEDVKNGALVPKSNKKGRKGLEQILEERETRFVSFNAWNKIDLKEKIEGELKSKPREKIANWEELLRVASE